MALLQDMSEQERQSWATLMVDVCVFSYFARTMVQGKEIASFEPAALMSVYIGIIIMTIIGHAIIAGIFALRVSGSDHEKDERDVDIERKGARNAFWVVSILINIIVFSLLAENSIGETFQGPISMTHPSHMFFALMGTAFLGDIVYRATMVLAYRG